MKKLYCILFFLYSLSLFATHNRAGEISYRLISGLTYEITIVTYTYTLSPADRPELEIAWGDGIVGYIQRIDSIHMPDDITKNSYVGQHTYVGPDVYIISFEDPNRNGGVLNIPNSVNVPFFVQSTLVINPFLGANNSPVLLNPPIDRGCVNQPFIHNPGAFDVDGDSISYKLVNCKGEDGLDIAGYSYPNAANSLTIDVITGDLLWDYPISQGEYNVAILIEEWRFGILIGSMTRDMQIEISTCNNHPPVIEEVKDTCVLAGTVLIQNIVANDVVEDSNIVTLTATGGPLMLAINPATFPQPVSDSFSVASVFTWQTDCEHVRKEPWMMTFKAIDNSSPVSLVDIESWLITVVAPAPPNLTAVPLGKSIILNWDISPCANAIGYKIYRRNGWFGFVPDACETGVPEYTGYSLIATVNNINTLSFTDNNNGIGLAHGIDYCYMVIAFFEDGAESYASNEACTTLKKDIPIITNVSILNTSTSAGKVYVAWSKPTELDTVQTPGPYKYLIYHSPDKTLNTPVLIDSLYIKGLNDTIYEDAYALNTLDNPWSYIIELWNCTPGNRFLVGATDKASSVFISAFPTDNKISLHFAPIVPWINDTFVVYRKNDITLLFDSIGYSITPSYTDSGLFNTKTYCYLVKSKGSYFADGLIDPIINYSQEICATPIDNTPSNPPHLTVIPDCELVQNLLLWTNPNNNGANDVLSYNIYYSASPEDDYTLLAHIPNVLDTFYLHNNLLTVGACYIVTAIDSFNNESAFSNVVCIDIDSCNVYTLPNVFTPDGDNVNDFFTPFPYDFVVRININIYNRWGQLVYATENPDILWDGKDKYSHQNCSDGVYFYVCDVFEIRLGGLKKRTIQGYVHLLRH